MNKKFAFSPWLLTLVGLGTIPLVTSVDAQPPALVQTIAQQAKTIAPQAVELINEGQQPRQELRFTPQVNSQEILTMTMNMDMNRSIEGQVLSSVSSPPIIISMTVDITAVDANGDIHADFVYSDIDVVANENSTPGVIESMRSSMEQLIGFQGSLLMDNLGNTKEVNFVLPDNLDATNRQLMKQTLDALKQISSPLPKEAIGIGAQWRHTNTVTVNGLTFDQITTYELQDIQGSVTAIKTLVEQQADPQPLNFPGIPPGASVNLVSYDAYGNGEMTLNLNQVMPTKADMSVNSEMVMKIQEDGSPESVTAGIGSVIKVLMEAR